MKRIFLLFIFPFLVAVAESSSLVPTSGVYLGMGLSANSTRFDDQNVTATGTSTVTDTASGNFVSSGTAGGPAVGISMGREHDISPSIQAGYFKRFKDSDYLWGAKLSYSYLGGSTATNDLIRIPQYGSWDGQPFTGNAIASSYQKTIKHQISLVPYIGKAFNRGTLYLGAGPTVSQVSTKINDLVGFADVNGQRTDISGSPQDFSDKRWTFGATVMVGGTYYLDDSFFLDVSYSYTRTDNKTSDYFSTYSNIGSPNTLSGDLIGSSTGTAKLQSITININKLF